MHKSKFMISSHIKTLDNRIGDFFSSVERIRKVLFSNKSISTFLIGLLIQRTSTMLGVASRLSVKRVDALVGERARRWMGKEGSRKEG